MSKSALGKDPFELFDTKKKPKKAVEKRSKPVSVNSNKIKVDKEISQIEKIVDEKFDKFKDTVLKSIKVIKNPEEDETIHSILGSLESILIEAQELLEKEKSISSLEKKKPIRKLSNLLKKLKDTYKIEFTGINLDDVKVDDFGFDENFYKKLFPILDFFYSKWFRVTMIGEENLSGIDGALLVANHAGVVPWDAVMLSYGIQKKFNNKLIRPLIENLFFYFPFIGSFFSKTGGIRANYENAKKLLNMEQPVAFFPEGINGLGKTVKDRYKLQRFARGGVVKLHLETGKPIIPLGIVGSEEIYPVLYSSESIADRFNLSFLPVTVTFPWLGPLGLIPLPSKWIIAIGKPVDFTKQYGKDAINDELLINKLTRELRGMVHELLYETLKERGSVFLG